MFSLEFNAPVSQGQYVEVQKGIEGVLRTIICHDSTTVHVALVNNSREMYVLYYHVCVYEFGFFVFPLR